MKILIKILLLLFMALFFGYPNYKLYYQPEFRKTGTTTYNHDVYQQLQHLKQQLRQGAAEEMQGIFPEGFVFMNALYGLAWCSLIQHIAPSSPIYQEGLEETSWAFQEINSDKGKATFNEALVPEYGAFYTGWSNYLLGSKLRLQASHSRDSGDVHLFVKNGDAIAAALRNRESPYLESYAGQCWPADMLAAMASLNLHDQLFENNRYQSVIGTWLEKVKTQPDPRTGLIPHSADCQTGATWEGARGSSQSLMLNFLKDLDPDFAQAQFQLYEKFFLDQRLWLPGIREYPKGKKGNGDIDSGPVIWDIGGAASIVGQRTMALYGDQKTYQGLRNCIEAFGIGHQTQKGKKYLFGKLPIADAFIAWSNSVEQQEVVSDTGNWRWKFQLLSVCIFLILTTILFFPNLQKIKPRRAR